MSPRRALYDAIRSAEMAEAAAAAAEAAEAAEMLGAVQGGGGPGGEGGGGGEAGGEWWRPGRAVVDTAASRLEQLLQSLQRLEY